MKNVRLTALAEFDLIEAQDFYAPGGDWVLDHFMRSINNALDDLAELAGIHPLRYGHHRMGVRHRRIDDPRPARTAVTHSSSWP